ncbi:hypothetical protein BE11_39825, partial [Sorangium cellulosum]
MDHHIALAIMAFLVVVTAVIVGPLLVKRRVAAQRETDDHVLASTFTRIVLGVLAVLFVSTVPRGSIVGLLVLAPALALFGPWLAARHVFIPLGLPRAAYGAARRSLFA